ncbi:hypothetical protein IE53DRAFT_31193 [Violaceomyces palustris]|uniref:Uncharacterized protein n=1 Tax=Violaceomyces palustris TaxID=1673888 RepID=A0ACD0P1C5_9BASI|nr:hypothetical protein IE53DRAFT_31193 [Violaceomyces palustris]
MTTDNQPSKQKKKRVLVVGGGASGMSALQSFSLSPEKFQATLYDKAPTLGGSATSYQLPDPEKYGAQYINDGVQGASPVFHNTFKVFHHTLGLRSSEVGMQISFGKGVQEFWSNVFPSDLVDRFKPDIVKFGRTLRTIKRFEPIFAVIPVNRMLKMFGFSSDFGERMVYPLVALFFGTGNETKNVSSAIIERVFLDPSMRLFEFSDESLLASVPTMMAFPELGRVYSEWRKEVTRNGNVEIETSREVVEIQRNTKEARKLGGNILVVSRRVNKDGKPLEKGDEESRTEVFDDLIMACDADSALKILGKSATWKERKVLGNVLYKWDITTTHNDLDYMKKHYEMFYDSKFNANRSDQESKKAFEFAEKNWKPLYLIKMYEDDPAQIEMSFDLTNYQPQFKGSPGAGEGARKTDDEAPPTERQGPNGKQGDSQEAQLSKVKVDPTTGRSAGEPPLEDHVFQTIFLDREISEKWTKSEIREDKIILEKWWKQQSHRWQLYAFTVPFLWTINGKNNTHFAGGWQLVNMHEVAIVSGYSAAYCLGAKYPYSDDEDCKRLFRLYHALTKMSRLRSEDRKGFFA